jgi:RNA polymerase sigma-70 factor (ECF subfamily)
VKPASTSHEQFERLAMPLLDPLFNYARWLTHDPTEAEDLVQETFAKALRGFDSFSPGTDFRAWIFRILRNTFLTSRTGLQAKLTVPLDAEDEAPVAVTWEPPETLALLRRAARRCSQRSTSCPSPIAKSSCCAMWKK